jgi:hypothetical protein
MTSKKHNKKIDLDFTEKVIIRQALTNEHYLSSIIEHLKLEYLKDVSIREVYKIVSDYYQKRGNLPTTSDIKFYLTTYELKEHFVKVFNIIKSLDKDMNIEEIYENTEIFIKQKGILFTMGLAAEQMRNSAVDSSDLLFDFEKVCNISLESQVGLDFFNDFSVIANDITKDEQYISTGWLWLDKQLNGESAVKTLEQ